MKLTRSVLSLSSRALRNSGESFWAASRALSKTWQSSSSFTPPSAPAPHRPAALPQASGPGSSCGDQVCWRWRRKILCLPTSTLMPCGEGAARQAEPDDTRARRSELAPLKQSSAHGEVQLGGGESLQTFIELPAEALILWELWHGCAIIRGSAYNGGRQT